MPKAKIAHRLERWVESLLPKPSSADPVIEAYIGYSTPTGAVVRGRVLARAAKGPVVSRVPILGNMASMARNFRTAELGDIEVSAAGVNTKSDEEGYFTLEVSSDAVVGGSVPVQVVANKRIFAMPVVTTDPSAQYGIISDIDDTIMQTGAYALSKNLWTTFTKSADARVVFDDSRTLIASLHNGVNPVFYVSSSPWNLHTFLRDVFARNELVDGPKFLRDYGISDDQFIVSSHGSHKGAAISTVLAANPQLQFVLMGDTGQHDAQVYRDVALAHPGRIAVVALRHAGPLDAEDEKALAAFEEMGVPAFSTEDFAVAHPQILQILAASIG